MKKPRLVNTIPSEDRTGHDARIGMKRNKTQILNSRIDSNGKEMTGAEYLKDLTHLLKENYIYKFKTYKQLKEYLEDKEFNRMNTTSFTELLKDL